MQQYIGVCREINTAHSMMQKDNAATFKNLSAYAETLIDQQTSCFENQNLYQEAFYRQELNARETQLTKTKQKAAERRKRAKAKIAKLRIQISELSEKKGFFAKILGKKVKAPDTDSSSSEE